MGYTVVYDVTNESMKLAWLGAIPLIMIGIAIIKYSTQKRDFGIFFTIFSSIWFLIVATSQISNYFEVQDIMSKKEYSTVEGIIRDFTPKAPRAFESFRVQDTYFEYSKSSDEYYGLNTPKAQGGPITGNGQKVRINYVRLQNRNFILRVTELK